MRTSQAFAVSCACNALLALMFVLALRAPTSGQQSTLSSPVTSNVASRAMFQPMVGVAGKRDFSPRIGMRSTTYNGNMLRSKHTPRVTLEAPVVDKVAGTDTMAAVNNKGDIPTGYRYYETMLLLQPRLTEMEKDIQLGYFEKVLGKGKV